jgi:uncharacterized membrane protein YheB (UPF0754 family)
MNKSLITNLLAILVIILGYLTPVYSFSIKQMGLYAFSGAITNWLAIHMLFEKVPFLYGSGIITNKFLDFKYGIRELIMGQFFSTENRAKVKDLFSFDAKVIVQGIDFDKAFIKVKEAILESSFGSMIGMFGGEKALEPLRATFKLKLEEIIVEITNDPKFLEQMNLDGEFFQKVESLVDKRLDELTPQMVKKIIQKMIREHLGWLVVWGGVFGAIIGLIASLL